MKKIIVSVIALIFASQLSNAQTQKGSQTAGLNLGLSYSSNSQTTFDAINSIQTVSNSKLWGFILGPQYSYFVANQLELGGSLSYGLNHINNHYFINGVESQPGKGSGKTYSGGAYLRKYFLYENKFGIRTGPFINYAYTSDKPVGAAVAGTANTLNAGLGLDLVYFPSKQFGVSASLASLSYQHSHDGNNNSGAYTQNNVNLNFDNNGLQLAVFYVFGGK